MNHPKSLHSMCAEISQDCFCLCPLGIWWFRSTSCSLPSASCQMLQQKVKSSLHKATKHVRCLHASGSGEGGSLGHVCMYEWFVLICDVWCCIATRAGLRMLCAEATKDKHKTWDLKTWAHTRHALGGRLWLHLTFEESNCHQVELLPSTSANWSHRSDKFGSVFTYKKKTKAKRDLFSPVPSLALNNFR